MENYINNIVADMREYMKNNPEATPENARQHVMDMVESNLAVESREHWHNAETFVLKALQDKELNEKAHDYIDGYRYMRVVLDGAWYELDAELYAMVCMLKKDEIIRKVKDLEK